MTDVMPVRQGNPNADLEAKYREESGCFYFTGVQALVRAPVDQMRSDKDYSSQVTYFRLLTNAGCWWLQF